MIKEVIGFPQNMCEKIYDFFLLQNEYKNKGKILGFPVKKHDFVPWREYRKLL